VLGVVIPNVTHVICPEGGCGRKEWEEWRRFRKVFVLSEAWVKDGFHLKSKISETEYLVEV
jgi:hypothetical protein